jgi:hypothetical protein
MVATETRRGLSWIAWTSPPVSRSWVFGPSRLKLIAWGATLVPTATQILAGVARDGRIHVGIADCRLKLARINRLAVEVPGNRRHLACGVKRTAKLPPTPTIPLPFWPVVIAYNWITPHPRIARYTTRWAQSRCTNGSFVQRSTPDGAFLLIPDVVKSCDYGRGTQTINPE